MISAARAEKQRRQQEKRQKQRDKEMQEAAAATVAVASSSDEMLEEDAESEEMSMSSPEEYDDNEDSSKCYSDDEWATLDDLQKVIFSWQSYSITSCVRTKMNTHSFAVANQAIVACLKLRRAFFCKGCNTTLCSVYAGLRRQ